MAKKIKTIIKLNIAAGEATAAPPVGPALGQHGLPIMDFVRSFNEKTQEQKGTGAAGKEIVGKLTRAQAQKIAEVKLPDLNTKNLDAAIRIVTGTAKSMGIEVEE